MLENTSLVGIGIPENCLIRYEQYLKSGALLLSVEVETPEQNKLAVQILESTGAIDVNTAKLPSVGKKVGGL